MSEEMLNNLISILASGKESLKFLDGLLRIISPEETPLNVIVDTFDFFDFYDIRVYPQLTNIFLLFMNQLNDQHWAGCNKDTIEISNFLQTVDEAFPSKEPWMMGDIFLAPNIFISHRLKNNWQLNTCINEIAKNLTDATIMPLSNEDVKLHTSSVESDVNKESNAERISMNMNSEEIETITLLNETEKALLKSEVILIPKPSVNSILTFLRFQGFREVLKDARGQIIFISSLVTKELDPISYRAFEVARLSPSSIGLSKALRGLVDVYLFDPIEAALKNQITRSGMKAVSCPLNLDTRKNRLHLAEYVLKLTSYKEIVESFDYKTKKEVDTLKQGLLKLADGLKRITMRPFSRTEDYNEEHVEPDEKNSNNAP